MLNRLTRDALHICHYKSFDDMILLPWATEVLSVDNCGKPFCVVSTTSCFAPRVPDDVIVISKLCRKYEVAHLVNNAYGIQSKDIAKMIEKASRLGRIDYVVQSMDKNFMVPVGGSIVIAYNQKIPQWLKLKYGSSLQRTNGSVSGLSSPIIVHLLVATVLLTTGKGSIPGNDSIFTCILYPISFLFSSLIKLIFKCISTSTDTNTYHYEQRSTFYRFTTILKALRTSFICNVFFPCCIGGYVYQTAKLYNSKLMTKITTPNSFEQEVLKRYVGFIGGMILSIILLFSLVKLAGLAPIEAIVISHCIGCVLAWGLAFNHTVRCFTLLAMPSFLSGQGRAVLYTLIIYIISRDIISNIMIHCRSITSTVSCVAVMGVDKGSHVMRMLLDPFHKAKVELADFLQNISYHLTQLKVAVDSLLEGVKLTGDVIRFLYMYLHTVIRQCKPDVKKTIVKEWERNQIKPESTKIHSLVTDKFDIFVKKAMMDILCAGNRGFNWIQDLFIANLERQMEEIRRKLDFNLTIQHSFLSNETHSNDPRTLLREINRTFENQKSFVRWMTTVSGYGTVFALLSIFVWVWYYHRRWMSSTKFNNKYIDYCFEMYDKSRAKLTGLSVLPLLYSDRQIELRPFFFLSKPTMDEMIKIALNLIQLLAVVVIVVFIIAMDFSLWKIIILLNTAMNRTIRVKEYVSRAKISINGTGIMAKIASNAINVMDNHDGSNAEFPLYQCSPDVSKPNNEAISAIGIILGLSFLTCVIQVFANRTRPLIMSLYHPSEHIKRVYQLHQEMLIERKLHVFKIFDHANSKIIGRDSMQFWWAVRKRILENRCVWLLLKLFRLEKSKDKLSTCIGCDISCKKDVDEKCFECSNIECIGEIVIEVHTSHSPFEQPTSYVKQVDLSVHLNLSDFTGFFVCLFINGLFFVSLFIKLISVS
ncbi:hypothetical protein GJ496_005028 [Pomphorhynchus laevis]|nr:hypothetical protein GJ496_005028 [Pomphorhynchus laevis]